MEKGEFRRGRATLAQLHESGPPSFKRAHLKLIELYRRYPNAQEKAVEHRRLRTYESGFLPLSPERHGMRLNRRVVNDSVCDTLGAGLPTLAQCLPSTY